MGRAIGRAIGDVAGAAAGAVGTAANAVATSTASVASGIGAATSVGVGAAKSAFEMALPAVQIASAGAMQGGLASLGGIPGPAEFLKAAGGALKDLGTQIQKDMGNVQKNIQKLDQQIKKDLDKVTKELQKQLEGTGGGQKQLETMGYQEKMQKVNTMFTMLTQVSQMRHDLEKQITSQLR